MIHHHFDRDKKFIFTLEIGTKKLKTNEQTNIHLLNNHDCFILRYILPLIFCLSGLILFSICVMVSTRRSELTPVRLDLNLVSNSVVVIGLRAR